VSEEASTKIAVIACEKIRGTNQTALFTQDRDSATTVGLKPKGPEKGRASSAERQLQKRSVQLPSLTRREKGIRRVCPKWGNRGSVQRQKLKRKQQGGGGGANDKQSIGEK